MLDSKQMYIQERLFTQLSLVKAIASHNIILFKQSIGKSVELHIICSSNTQSTSLHVQAWDLIPRINWNASACCLWSCYFYEQSGSQSFSWDNGSPCRHTSGMVLFLFINSSFWLLFNLPLVHFYYIINSFIFYFDCLI